MEPTADIPTTDISPAPVTDPLPPLLPAPLVPPAAQPKSYRLIIILLLILVGILGWFAVLQSYSTQVTKSNTPTVDAIRASGKLTIGTDATFAPMEFTNDAGEYTGYDIELGHRIAEKLGVTPVFKQIVFDNFIDELTSHNVDIVMSSVSITEERKQKVQFSDPYLYAGQVILTRKDNTAIKSTADLKGKKIAVQKGTTNEEQARAFTSPELILLYDDYTQATEALLHGQADAIFSDLTGAKGIIGANPTLKVASEPFTQESYGIVFPPGEEDFVGEVNSIVNGLRQQGILTFLKQKWLD